MKYVVKYLAAVVALCLAVSLSAQTGGRFDISRKLERSTDNMGNPLDTSAIMSDALGQAVWLTKDSFRLVLIDLLQDTFGGVSGLAPGQVLFGAADGSIQQDASLFRDIGSGVFSVGDGLALGGITSGGTDGGAVTVQTSDFSKAFTFEVNTVFGNTGVLWPTGSDFNPSFEFQDQGNQPLFTIDMGGGEIRANTYGVGTWTDTDDSFIWSGDAGGRFQEMTFTRLADSMAVYLGSGVSFGAENQVPVVNPATDDFDYSANFAWDDTRLTLLTGTGNVFIGATAAPAWTSGTNNTFLGVSTGDAITSGGSNTFIGYSAGSVSSISAQFTAVGAQAAGNTAAGFRNTVVGYQAFFNGGGNDHVGVGYQALYEIAGNANNVVAIGREAGRSVDGNGDFSVNIGDDAGFNNDGGNSIVIGQAAGFDNTGSEAILIGSDAGSANTANLIAVGGLSGLSNTGANNVFIGQAAGSANAGGANNVFIGHNVGMSNSTGEENTFLGSVAGNAVASSEHVGIGYNVLGSHSGTGVSNNGNTAIGWQAAGNYTTGGYNTVLGYSAGSSATNADNSVLIGAFAGADAGDNNVIVGAEAGQAITGSGNVVIGYGSGEIADFSNELWIENSLTNPPLVWGDFAGDSVVINGDFRVAEDLRDISGAENPAGYIAIGQGAGSGFLWVDTTGLFGGAGGGGSFGAEYEIPFTNNTGDDFNYFDGFTFDSSTLVIQGGISVSDGASTPNIFITSQDPSVPASLTTGNTNTVIGNLAGDAITSSVGNVLIGNQAGSAVSSGTGFSVAVGVSAGRSMSTAGQNTYVGTSAGRDNTAATNTMIGYLAGSTSTAGFSVVIGGSTGQSAAGNFQTVIGNGAGSSISGNENAVFGYNAGRGASMGANNTLIGARAGEGATGARNVFIGYDAGSNETGSDLLYIDNSDTSSPLIHGNFSTNTLQFNGLTLTENIRPRTDDTYYLGKNDDDTPLAWKGLILRDQTTGTYYRLQIDSGAVSLIDLTD